MGADLRVFERAWLEPAGIAPPVIEFAPQTSSDGAVRVTVEPLRPEDADWNHWPGEGYRLFNNRAALLFTVTVEAEGLVRWVPQGTRLELNVAGNPITAARVPDDLLEPLLAAALLQEQWGLDGDLVARTRAAGPFRTAYLPSAPVDAPVAGVIAFPLVEPERHVHALRLTVQVETGDGPHFFSWLFD